MNLITGVEQGLREIWAHKFRSGLTMLGVVLGVSSLIAMFAISAGMIKGSRKFMTAIGGLELVTIKEATPPAWQDQIAAAGPGRTYGISSPCAAASRPWIASRPRSTFRAQK